MTERLFSLTVTIYIKLWTENCSFRPCCAWLQKFLFSYLLTFWRCAFAFGNSTATKKNYSKDLDKIIYYSFLCRCPDQSFSGIKWLEIINSTSFCAQNKRLNKAVCRILARRISVFRINQYASAVTHRLKLMPLEVSTL